MWKSLKPVLVLTDSTRETRNVKHAMLSLRQKICVTA